MGLISVATVADAKCFDINVVVKYFEVLNIVPDASVADSSD